MFARPQRLTEKKVFQIIFRQGTWVRGRSFSIRYIPSQGAGQIAFVVSKKIAKDATVRNRIKRRLRASFKSLLNTPEYSELLVRNRLLVIVHRVLDLTPLQLTQEVTQLLEDLKTKQGKQA